MAASAPEGEHRRQQHAREFGHLGAGILRAAADHDHGACRVAEPLRRFEAATARIEAPRSLANSAAVLRFLKRTGARPDSAMTGNGR